MTMSGHETGLPHDGEVARANDIVHQGSARLYGGRRSFDGDREIRIGFQKDVADGANGLHTG